MITERIPRIDDIDMKRWTEANVGTSTIWKESEVYEIFKSGTLDEWADFCTYEDLEVWCRLMMASILGKEVAMNKYPEMWL
jgi:hypothetical protein